MTNIIELTDLTKTFGPKTAVKSLNLKVARGEIFGWLGPNGSGKTTTIKMITGLYRPTRGRVSIGGFDLEKEPIKAKALVGYIPDEPFVYEQLTGFEFLNFVGAIFGIPPAPRRAKIAGLLELFPNMESVDGCFQDYSRGTKQKFTILAALLHDPQVLVIDEPMVGLDPESIRIFKNMLRDFVAGGDRTVFVSTHSLETAESVCTRIGILKSGSLIETGTLSELQDSARLSAGGLEELFLVLTNA